MLSDSSKEMVTEKWKSAKQQVTSFLQSFDRSKVKSNLIGLVINPQYLKLLKIRQVNNQYEVEYFNIVELPEGLMKDLEISNPEAIADHLKKMMNHAKLGTNEVVMAIPRSATIVKTITVDHRLTQDEIESRVWLEAGRLFPNLIGDIYLDFVVNGSSPLDSTKHEVLIVACRKEQLTPYLDILRLSNLTAKVVDVNYYAYERALSLITSQSPEAKSVAFINIRFGMIDLLGIHEGKLVYTHELAYDGQHLMKLRYPDDRPVDASEVNDTSVFHEAFKNTIGLHLKHALQFFYSSRPNVRLDKIILGGDVPATIPGVLEFVRKETAKSVELANPFTQMKIAPTVNAARLMQYSPAMMLCCGLALTGLSTPS